MDEETRKKINDLAKNLKELHLVSTLEEAQKRAEDIILSTVKGGEKSIKELMEEKQKKEIPKIDASEDDEEPLEEAETTDTEPEKAEEE